MALLINSDLFYRETVDGDVVDLLPNPATELASSVNFIADLITQQSSLEDSASEQEVIMDTVEKYVALREENSAVAESIKIFGRQLGEELSRAYSVLKNDIAPHVTSLAKSIDIKSADILSAQSHNGSTVLADGTLVESRSTFDVVGWDAISSNSSLNTSLCQEYFGTDNIADINVGDGFTLQERLGGTNLWPIHEDTTNYLITTLTGALQANGVSSKMTPAEVIAAVLTCDTGYLTTIVAATRSCQYGAAINQCKYVLFNLKPALTVMDSLPLDISDELHDQIHNNLRVLNDMIGIATVVLIYIRNILANNKTLIITPAMVNEDMYEELRSAGSSPEEVGKYIAVEYPDSNRDESINIALSDMLAARDNVITLFEQHKESVEASKQVIIRRALITASAEILTDFGNHVCSNEKHVADTVRVTCQTLDQYNEVPMETVLYNFVISLLYSGSLVEAVYRKIGSKTQEVLEAVGSTTSEVLDITEAAALADIVAEYVVTKLFVTHDELNDNN